MLGMQSTFTEVYAGNRALYFDLGLIALHPLMQVIECYSMHYG